MPYISRIQRFSPDDGPGVRTTVFFKGCTLNCAWCHNPECIEPKKTVSFAAESCIGCGHCGGKRELPKGGCPAQALKTDGFTLSAEEIVAEAAKDKRYYKKTGGLTLSGGEPLIYPDFMADICRAAAKQDINVAIDTALHVPWANIEKLLPFRPLFLADVKAASPETHRRFTGAGNELILENLIKLAASGARYWVSIPIVPGANTAELPAIAEIIKALPLPPEKVRLLPYHTMGIKKEETYALPPRGRFAPPTEQEMEEYRKIF